VYCYCAAVVCVATVFMVCGLVYMVYAIYRQMSLDFLMLLHHLLWCFVGVHAATSILVFEQIL
jgi:hypothetical protein